MSRSHTSRPGFAVTIARTILWPLRRFFDPRFAGLDQQADVHHDDMVQRLDAVVQRLDTLHTSIHAASLRVSETLEREMAQLRHEFNVLAHEEMDAFQEANELMGRSLGDLLAEASSTTAAMEELLGRRLGLGKSLPVEGGGSLEDLDAGAADVLKGRVRPANTNERIVELPYVYRALGAKGPGASILDVGTTESMLAVSLASLGYYVTALDTRGYSLAHPRLRVVKGDIFEWETSETFDAVLCVSTLEHIGLEVYDAERKDDSADRTAVERIRALTRPGGILVLTVPFGAGSAGQTRRSYDRPKLERLLEGWRVEDLTIVRQEDDLTWSAEGSGRGGNAAERRVALVTAVRSSS